MNPLMPLNTNLELFIDSAPLRILPLKDSVWLYQGDRVVVAEFDVHPVDSSVWVKLAHSEDVQGWINQSDIVDSFVPADSISQFIHWFSNSYVPYFIAFVAIFLSIWIYRLSIRKQTKFVFFNDIGSLYPLFLCLLMATSATVYQSIQMYAPEMWQYYYFNPTLSPWEVPSILSAFLLCIWGILIVGIASTEVVFRSLPSGSALLYLLGLVTSCIFCYVFFIWTTRIYLGYIFLLGFACLFLIKLIGSAQHQFKCGNCGKGIKKKGACPFCGVVNE
ncbi:hypothetical protein [Bacteroides sp. 224]|uniref:hypothetical protein n=1 Tax=Bacteroides sp. 224 TaxID=2302936 RepID=UPI0013D28366|nr:hypothetical protein [Bacteroides sp. 224]NDV64090.1 hypothetical protein [Bacteroides sp. 224]